MARKMNFWKARTGKSQKARHGWRNRPYGRPVMSMERLEDRYMLAANPVLSLESNQFFGAGGSFTPFRATFTDVVSDGPQTFDYSINWGDSSPVETGNTFRFTSDGPGALRGIFEVNHAYASAGQYTVSVTLTNGLNDSDTEQTQVNVYPIDNGLRVDGYTPTIDQENTFIYEGTPFDFSLREAVHDPFTPLPTIQDISSWTINWGDSIQTINSNPTSVTHSYGDDDFYPAAYPDSVGTRRITVAATGSNGTYFAWGGFFTDVKDVAAVSTIDGPSEINEGQTYTLNLSATDPGDPVDNWIVSWGDGAFDTVTGNPVSVDHVYQDGDASLTIFAGAISGQDFLDFVFTPVTVHNVAPTLDDTTLSVPENSPNGTLVGTLPAVNLANDDLTFTVLSGNEAGAFAVDPTTGEISVINSSLLDIATHPTFSLNVEVSDGEGGIDTANVTINVTRLANISGAVFVDVNHNGLFDANEPGIDGVTIKLLNQSGNPVLDGGGDPITTLTSNGGLYLFEALQPGIYQVSEVQPTGVSDGGEQLGSLGGTIVANDRMQLTITGADAFDYAFAEFGQQVTSGDSAGVGFWHGKNGQELIAQGGTQLAAWLTSHFGNVFGNTLVGMTGSQVASFYRDQVFKGVSKSGGTPKADANFMAVALATYFTSKTLAGQVAASYGFHVTDTGIGTRIVNVGTKGAAFSVANGSNRTIMQLLLATNNLTDQPNSTLGYVAIYDKNGDGAISSAESSLRAMADSVFSEINASGGI